MRCLDKLLSVTLIFLIKAYQKGVAPFFVSPCRHIPSCSRYGLEAIAKHGSFKGAWFLLKRLAHCHPWGSYGYDPVPEKAQRCKHS